MNVVFGRDVTKPGIARKPTYDVGHPETAAYEFPCVVCQEPVSLDLTVYLGFAAGRDDVLGDDNRAAIREHFDLNLVGKAHDGGWPRLRVEACRKCATRYLVYVGVKEPTNSWFQVTVQGIVELIQGPWPHSTAVGAK